MLASLASAYRRTGADLPWGDPRPTHGVEMEGYFWRFSDVTGGRVAVALCGVNRHPDGAWATVAVALHPGGVVRHAVVDGASADRGRLHVVAGDAFEADDTRVRASLDGVEIDATLDPAATIGWPRRPLPGGGLASVVPFLNQYWHPHVLGGRASVRGTVSFDAADVYAEKNWGAGFPKHWWWGQAHGFDRADVCVAFSGGRLELGPLGVDVGGIVVRVGADVVRLAPPLAVVRSEVGGGRWRMRGRDLAGNRVDIDADDAGTQPHVLPVPMPAERRQELTDFEHQAGRLHVVAHRRGRLLYEGESRLAALEWGWDPRNPPSTA